MTNTVQPMAENFRKQHTRQRRWQKLVTVLAAIVVFCTTYALILPAITWDRTLICELEEHTHTDACWGEVTVPAHLELICTEDHEHTGDCFVLIEEHTEPALICGREEHVHTDACFDAPPAADEGYFCGLIEHQHNDLCYFSDGSLRCTLPEHIHTRACESDPAADVETAADWEKSVADVTLTGNWADDVLAVAQSQLGVGESEKNFEVDADGKVRGYTRYGAWYGEPYGDWCALFCAFSIRSAGVDADLMPISDNCELWTAALEKQGLYHTADEYLPRPGDLLFIDRDEYDPEAPEARGADHVGIVAEVIPAVEGQSTLLRTIEGNADNHVKYVTYSAEDTRILGFGALPAPVKISTTAQGHLVTLEAVYGGSGNYDWQWQVSEDGENWSDIPGATELTYRFLASEDDMGNLYRVVGSEAEETAMLFALSMEADEGDIISVNFDLDEIADLFSGETPILVVAASDFQDPNTSPSGGQYRDAAHDYTTQNARLTTIMGNIMDYYHDMDAYAFFAGGDYGFDSNLSEKNTNNGITQIKNTVEAALPNLEQEIFVQGNHDNTTGNWTGSGAYDTDYYGVFAIAEDDFPAKTGTPKAATLTSLDNYLAGRVTNHPDQPVFILTHVPLHFDLRTVAEGDGMYGKRLFDIVSAYGDDLNIIFLYGHNHAHGDDDYIGGSSNFYTVGDTIKVAKDGSRSEFTNETLNFTYMNYGYTGYYWEKWVQSDSAVASLPACNADDTLTMTSFLIEGNSVEICRWDDGTDGTPMHNLKSAGAASNGDHVSGSWNTTLTPDTTVVASPKTVTAPVYQEYTDTATGIVGRVAGETPFALNVRNMGRNCAAALEEDLTNFVAYEITATGYNAATMGKITVKIPAIEGMDTIWWLNPGTGELVEQASQISGGYITFETDHFSTWVYGGSGSGSGGGSGLSSGDYWVRCTAGTDVTAGGTYMIVSGGKAFGITTGSSPSATAGTVSFTDTGEQQGGKTLYSVTGDGSTAYFRWTFSSATGGTIQNVGNTGKYFDPSQRSLLSNSVATVTAERSGENWRFRDNPGKDNDRRWLQYTGSSFSRSNKNDSSNANMTVYKKVTVEAPPATLAVMNTSDGTTTLSYTLKTKATDDYGTASAVSGLNYTIYNPDNSVPTGGTGTLPAGGGFSLAPGQYIVIEGLTAGTHYYVCQSDNANVTGTTAGLNGGTASAPSSGTNEKYVHFSPTASSTTSVEFINSETPILTVSLDVIGRDANVTDSTKFALTVLGSGGTPAAYTSYTILNADGTTAAADVPYNSASPAIELKPGQTAKIKELTAGSYTVEMTHADYLGDPDDTTVTVPAVTLDGTPASSPTVTSGVLSVGGVGATSTLAVSGRAALFTGYTITFDYGDGVTDPTDPNRVPYLTTDLDGVLDATLPLPERDGYIFIDWHTAPDAEGYEVAQDRVYTGDTTLYAHWIEASKKATEEIERTANVAKDINEATAYKPTTEQPDKNPENVFDIDLKADLPSTKKQAVVLLFDLSSSMEQFCAECGQTSGSHRTSTDTGYDGSSVSNSLPTGHTAYIDRLDVAIAEGQDFIDKLMTQINNGADGDECYVEVVGFSNTASVQKSGGVGVFKLVKGDAAGNAETLKSIIDAMDSGSGTNIGAGLGLAYSELNNIIETYTIPTNNSYVILLSDGAPTTNTISANLQAYVDYYNNQTASAYSYISDDALNPSLIARYKEIWQMYDHFSQWYQDVWDRGDHFNYDPTKNSFSTADGAKAFMPKQIMGAPYYATQLHKQGSHLYSVVFGTNKDYNKWQSANNYKYVPGIGIDNVDYVRSFSEGFAHATNATQLDAFYTDIVDAVRTQAANGSVTDPMSDSIVFLGFKPVTDTVWVSADGCTAYNNATMTGDPIATYNSITNTVTWHPTATVPNITYQVRLKNEAEGFREGTEYLTNGETTLTYQLMLGDQTYSEPTTKSITLPHVHGWLGELSFVKVGSEDNISANYVPLEGATFKLSHDPNCPVCDAIADNASSDKLAVIGDFTVTSDETGIISFAGVPSGHTYIMTETSAPSGYLPAVSYTVKIAYDEVTITPIANDSGRWSGSAGSYQLADEYSGGVELPSTGGEGIRFFKAFGVLTLSGTLLYGFIILRRKRKRRSD